MINDEDLVFFDIENFEWDTLVILKDINNNILGHPFWNSRERQQIEIQIKQEGDGYNGPKPLDVPSGFEEIAGIIKGKTLVGYNNFYYDNPMLVKILNNSTKQETIHATNNSLIFNGGTHIPALPYLSLDTMQQISVAHPSLKQIEGNMGKSIKETDVDFSIGRALTDEERQLTEFYCAYDVENTIEVYKLRKKSYFAPKESLLSMIEDPDIRERMKNRNTTAISAQILTKGKPATVWLKHQIPEHLWNEDFRRTSGIDREVWDMWDDAVRSVDATLGKGKSKKQVTDFGVFVFGLGGLHGAPVKPIRRGRCKHKDVKSMYPSAIVTLKALDDVETYDSIRKERVSIKKSDPVRAAALKLILNSVYGQFKSKYSDLYNPLASSTVCIYGQIALFTLCKRLYEEGHYEIINANTDGVVYCDTSQSIDGEDDRICKEWEKQFHGFELDTDVYTEWIQKDVNNYIAVERDGKITVKGGEVNKFAEDKFFANNNARIIQIAMVEKLLHPKQDIIEILMDHIDDHRLWQYVLKAGSTFEGVVDKTNHIQQKVNRVFAASKYSTMPTTKLYKLKRSPEGEPILINFPDVPEEMILWNDDVSEIPDFEQNIDIKFYAELVNKKLRGWPDVH